MKKLSALALAFLLAACSTPNQKPNSAGTPITSASASPTKSDLKIAPDVALTDLATGSSLKFADIPKPVVVTFWASWCTTCREEFGLWRDQALAKNVIGINVQDARASSKLKTDAYNLMKENGTTFPSYIDSAEVLTSHLGIVGLPVTIVVASDGSIVARHDGVMTKQAMLRFIAMTKD
ncbi:MAG: TlpA disulfide reductase family protein [Actinobacteria bacterium]|nr:TlpA disulfide reductase family protein [Actinomycetota bacterium]